MSAIADHFEGQAKHCDRLGSPFTARLCRLLPSLLDSTTRTGRAILQWPGNPGRDALALRICGALHALVLSGKDHELVALWPPNEPDSARFASCLPAALTRHDEFIRDFLDKPPQTNEVARSSMLLPGFLEIARRTGLPLQLAELGASAGLNLSFDSYRYSYAGSGWGLPISDLLLAPETRGVPPDLSGPLAVTRRSGCDISPLNMDDEAHCMLLRAYVWADQEARLTRLNEAIRITRDAKVRVHTVSAQQFTARQLVSHEPGAALTVFHSIMWGYMTQAERDGIAKLLDAAGCRADAESPLAWLRMEPKGQDSQHATLTLTLWPGGEPRDLAQCDFHGRWIQMC